ncbi:MAG: type II toxin-antitoxin system VapC family toxin [Candidatus Beckwithbacteria bacterium]|nr:type II toxin-antitoxin system VapC family toxin [Patescibacteria group bacterium]
MKYLLDTDVLIWILRGNEKVVKRVKKLVKNKRQAVSVISVAEIYKNLFPSEIEKTSELFEASLVLEVDYKVAKLAGLYWRDYHKKYRGLSLADCLIASSAKVNNLKVMSGNVKHFPMLKGKVVNPLKNILGK